MSAVKRWHAAAPAAVTTIGLILAGCTAATPAAGPSQPGTPTRTQPAGTGSAAGSAAAGGSTPAGSAATDGSTVAGSTRPDATVVLRIDTPRSGQTIGLPAPVSYATTGLQFGSSAGYHLRVEIGQPASYTLDLPITGPSGTVELPVDKNLPGRRTLTFTITRGDNVAIAGPQASVTLQDVTITGPR